jgi:hypothetical protein
MNLGATAVFKRQRSPYLMAASRCPVGRAAL